jgi:transcriptional coactivator HFI1/ADA1
MVHLQRIHNQFFDWYYSAAQRASAPIGNLNVYADTFGVGRLNQAEFSERIEPILASPDGSKEHLHNQLIAAIYGNVTREMPDQGLAPWVSTNDKPSPATGSKPVSGDATERRLKGEVMQLPARDRRRIKDLAHNDVSQGVQWGIAEFVLTACLSLTPTNRSPMCLRIRPGCGLPRRPRSLPVPGGDSAG